MWQLVFPSLRSAVLNGHYSACINYPQYANLHCTFQCRHQPVVVVALHWGTTTGGLQPMGPKNLRRDPLLRHLSWNLKRIVVLPQQVLRKRALNGSLYTVVWLIKACASSWSNRCHLRLGFGEGACFMFLRSESFLLMVRELVEPPWWCWLAAK